MNMNGFVIESGVLLDYNGNATNLEIPEGIHTIVSGAFKNNSNIQNVLFPKTLKKIRNAAFWACRNLKAMKFNDGLEVIEENAFSFCNSLEKVVIPDSITEIGKNAFASCPKLKTIELPAGFLLGNPIFLPFQDVNMIYRENKNESSFAENVAKKASKNMGNTVRNGSGIATDSFISKVRNYKKSYEENIKVVESLLKEVKELEKEHKSLCVDIENQGQEIELVIKELAEVSKVLDA